MEAGDMKLLRFCFARCVQASDKSREFLTNVRERAFDSRHNYYVALALAVTATNQTSRECDMGNYEINYSARPPSRTLGRWLAIKRERDGVANLAALSLSLPILGERLGVRE
jgi:hypothetical protein